MLRRNTYRILFSIPLMLGICLLSYGSNVDYLTKVNNFILDGFEPSLARSFRYEDDLKYLSKKFGKILAIEKKVELDRREPGVKNELKNIKFKGVELKMATPLTGAGRTTWIEYVSLTSAKYRLKHGLKIGTHKSDFIKILGKPRKESGRTITYMAVGEGSKVLTIEFDSKLRSKKITWEYFID